MIFRLAYFGSCIRTRRSEGRRSIFRAIGRADLTYGSVQSGRLAADPPACNNINDLGYNWSFKIDLEDLAQLNQSRKEEYYPLGAENEFCGSTISKQTNKRIQ